MPPRPAVPALMVALASCVALPIVSAGAAQAETWSHRDATRDVVVVSTDPDDEDGQDAAPRDRRTDVRRVALTHSRQVIRVRLKVRDVTGGNQVTQLSLRGPGRTVGFAALLRVDGRDRLMSHVFSGEEATRCRDASGQIRPRQDSVIVTVPTSCLAHPEWVRVSASYGTFDGRPATADAVRFDDALSRRVGGLTGESPMSPKVHVG